MLVQLVIHLTISFAFVESCPSKCTCNSKGEVSCTRQNLTSKDIETMLFPNNATMLNLTDNLLTYLPTKIFSNHTKLKTIDLRINLMDEIPSYLSSEIPSLNIIHLNNNKIKELKGNSFDGYDKIITLDLSGNQLKNIPANVFEKCADLLHLNLRANQIDIINDRSFGNLKKLRILSLSENKIYFIPVGSFNDLTNIEVIKVDANKLKMIAEGLFSTLKTLIELHLANNEINKVLPKAFQNHDFKVLDLSGNNISTLSKNWFLEVYSDLLKLDGNPIVCDCRMSLRADRHLVTGLCQYPADLKDTPIEKVVYNNYLNCTVCSINPCQNAGKCVLQSNPDTYICVCEPMYKGINCTTKKKGCELNPCLNNATCSNVYSTEKYVCNCSLNYTGRNCENLKVCLSNPCHNNGVCIENVSLKKHRCKCQIGFHGTFCEKKEPFDKKKLSPGWIALIIISVVVFIIVASILYFCKFRRQRSRHPPSEESPLKQKTVI